MNVSIKQCFIDRFLRFFAEISKSRRETHFWERKEGNVMVVYIIVRSLHKLFERFLILWQYDGCRQSFLKRLLNEEIGSQCSTKYKMPLITRKYNYAIFHNEILLWSPNTDSLYPIQKKILREKQNQAKYVDLWLLRGIF